MEKGLLVNIILSCFKMDLLSACFSETSSSRDNDWKVAHCEIRVISSMVKSSMSSATSGHFLS